MIQAIGHACPGHEAGVLRPFHNPRLPMQQLYCASNSSFKERTTAQNCQDEPQSQNFVTLTSKTRLRISNCQQRLLTRICSNVAAEQANMQISLCA
eukprot:1593769-Amphidinium_carterae.6